MFRYMLLFLLGLAVMVPGITQLPPVDRDEARFIQATKQMVESGDYTNIQFQNEPRNQKPAGIHWLQAAGLSLFGGADAPVAAYRIVSVVAVAAAVSAMYWFGNIMFGPVAGLIAALMLAGTFGAGELGEAGRLTMVISVGLLWATAFPLLVHLAKRQNP